jgi:hypothetical protein
MRNNVSAGILPPLANGLSTTKRLTACVGVAAVALAVSADPALAQAVGGTMPSGRFGIVVVGLITFILLAVGVTVVALGIGKGGFEMAIGNNGGAGNIVKAVAIGGLIASGLAIAVWAVGNALTTTTIPGLSG